MAEWPGAVDVANVVLSVAAFPMLGVSAYLGVLATFARAAHTRTDAPRGSEPVFDVIVPAHDEEICIAATVRGLLQLDYPREKYRVIVVADNCTDQTAELARRAGATVEERHDAAHRGKGHALAWAFERSLARQQADAVIVVDADTTVSANLLREFAAALSAGASVMQAHYGVRDASTSWRTRLTSLAFTLFHGVRSSARERLRLSCGLRGNGMCFRNDVLQRVPHRAFSIVEDLEYGIALGLVGIRVTYLDRAMVSGDMPATTAAAGSQRKRWEGGRRQLRGQYGLQLFRQAAARRDLMLLDLALDLLVPPLSTIMMATGLGLIAATVGAFLAAQVTLALLLWGAVLIGVLWYVLRGCLMTGNLPRALADLSWAPLYMIWKLGVRAIPAAKRSEWVRTTRTPLGKRDA